MNTGYQDKRKEGDPGDDGVHDKCYDDNACDQGDQY